LFAGVEILYKKSINIVSARGSGIKSVFGDDCYYSGLEVEEGSDVFV